MADLAELKPGVEHTLESVVEGERLVTDHVGGQGVFATPGMIWLMEWAAHHAVEPYLRPDQTTVGYEVCVRHLAPTLPGATVRTTARVKEFDGRKLLFDVECREGDKLVGTGTHKRAIAPAVES
jgi:predicted thioesterase